MGKRKLSQVDSLGKGTGRKIRIDNYFSVQPKLPKVPTSETFSGTRPLDTPASLISDDPTPALADETCETPESPLNVPAPTHQPLNEPAPTLPALVDLVGSESQSISSCIAPTIPHAPPVEATASAESNCYDIGNAVGRTLTDQEAKDFLTNTWQPDSSYPQPFSIHGPRKRYLQYSVFKQYDFPAYSAVKKGLYCKYCVVAGVRHACDAKQTALGKLVKTPLSEYKDLTGKTRENNKLLDHSLKEYHQKSKEICKNILAVIEKPQLDVRNQVNLQRENLAKENRKRLRPIVETVIFLGRQNIAFRGHRDDGTLDWDDSSDDSGSDSDNDEGSESVVSNRGNFRAALKYRIRGGDVDLMHHLKTAGANATYISKTTQNQLIDACREEITAEIIRQIKQAKYYSIMFDETTDASTIEQLSISFRSVH